MDYLIVNTSLMVKGKNYPEGEKISDSVLSEDDLKNLAKYLKPFKSNETNTVTAGPVRNQKGKGANKPA